VVVSGLPGTGKSFFCRQLAQRVPSVILESDALRKKLFPSPNYSIEESGRLFSACHLLLVELLEKGIPVIFDATNLSERHREHLYRISDEAGAKFILVSIEAPSGVVRQRLQKRKEGVSPEDKSDAGWEVYQKMKENAQKIRRNHFVVDTSRDIKPAIDKIVRAIRNW
jgi:predicted kinase